MRTARFIYIIFFLIFFLFFKDEALPWTEVTHENLSKYASENSVLRKCKDETDQNCDYLKNLAFEKGLLEELIWYKTKTIKDWLAEGAHLEDETTSLLPGYGVMRSVNHFHNPLKQWLDAGLDDEVIIPLPPFILHYTGESSLLWAQDKINQENHVGGDWSWKTIRDKYYWALTDTAEAQRQLNFAQTFRGLGHQMHLIEDAAQPDHVRNDAHPEDSAGIGRSIHLEKWAGEKFSTLDNLKSFTSNRPSPVLFPEVALNISYNNLVPITQLIDTKQYYNGGTPSTSLSQGIAEYTNANFASDDTIFTENQPITDRHYFPYPKKSSTNLQELIDKNILPETVIAEDGVQEPTLYIKKDKDGEIINRFLKPTYTATGRWDLVGGGQIYELGDFYRDEKCHEDYASLLIPRAVGYSAGLLDYFFRGTLEITMPDSYIYSITDGSVIPQQFTRITAKVRNSTPDSIPGEEIQGCDAVQQNCIIQAVARYKKRTDYQPDLSTDPPTSSSREPDYSYSVSAPIAITSLSSITPTEFTFDFTSSPIPAGITDLYLHVVFKGTLGNETDIAIAVGMKDLNEPQHFSIWNATDRFYLDGVLRTASEIRNNPALLSRVDHNGDSISDEPIDPYDVTTEIAFYPTGVTPTIYNATFTPLPSGRYGRIIMLTDMPNFYIRLHRSSANPLDENTADFLFSGVTNQDINGTFQNTQVITFRGIIQHTWSAYARSYPDAAGISTAPWPSPANINPYPATTLYP